MNLYTPPSHERSTDPDHKSDVKLTINTIIQPAKKYAIGWINQKYFDKFPDTSIFVPIYY
jgi:hypothetical protein